VKPSGAGLTASGPAVVAVFGSSAVDESDPVYRLARELGGELARGGAAVMTGGYGGVMAACSRGAREAGGHVIGVTVELYERRGPANPWVDERVHAPDLFERLRHLVGRADGYVALPGSLGTLTELFLTWTLLSAAARPATRLVLLGERWAAWLEAHRDPQLVPPSLFEHVRMTTLPAEAARWALVGVPVGRWEGGER
jgi:hypothetical protein